MKTNKQVRGPCLLFDFFLVIIVLLLGALGIGLMIGYGIVGKGQDPWAILTPAKWQELISKIYRKIGWETSLFF